MYYWSIFFLNNNALLKIMWYLFILKTTPTQKQVSSNQKEPKEIQCQEYLWSQS